MLTHNQNSNRDCLNWKRLKSYHELENFRFTPSYLMMIALQALCTHKHTHQTTQCRVRKKDLIHFRKSRKLKVFVYTIRNVQIPNPILELYAKYLVIHLENLFGKKKSQAVF
jgi:hypothetical protein